MINYYKNLFQDKSYYYKLYQFVIISSILRHSKTLDMNPVNAAAFAKRLES